MDYTLCRTPQNCNQIRQETNMSLYAPYCFYTLIFVEPILIANSTNSRWLPKIESKNLANKLWV